MPIREYECENCGNRFERIQKFSDPPVDVCPKCGSGPVHKLISSPAFQFKGTGWYITDYAKKDSPAGKGDSKDAGGKEGGKESGKEGSSAAESKSAESKSESKSSETKTDGGGSN